MVAKLCNIVVQIDRACQKQVSNLQESSDWRNILSNALDELVLLLQDERALSAYELHSSGLVQALQKLLGKNNYEECSMLVCHSNKLQKDRASVFKKCFKDRSFNDGPVLPSVTLVRKLIAVLELIEKLPVYLYDTPGAGVGLQMLTRMLRFRLERASGEVTLIDRTGRGLKLEPLTTVGQLEKYLVKMVAKQWYDYDRSTFTFVKKLKEPNVKITFTHRKDFDDNGVIYWIGTNARTSGEWVNPAQVGLVFVTSSEGRNLPYGRLEDILNRDSSALNCHTSDDKRAWFAIDLGLWLVPNCYTLRHAIGYGRSALRNWFFQVSKDGVNWTTLYAHSDDCSLNEPGSTASWPLDPPPEETQGWRHIRLQQTGKNASGQTHYLSLSDFEIYGTVTGICDDLAPATTRATKKFKRFHPSVANKVVTKVSSPVATLQGIPEDEDSRGPLSTAQSYPSLTATTTASTSSGSQFVNASATTSFTMSLASTSSKSERDFLESCSTTVLLADSNDDENEDDGDYEDVLEEEGYELRNGKRRSWDDEFVLKRQFSALIPAFDPRPGRTNINQTTDLEIPPPGSEESTSEEIPTQPKLSLQLKGPNIPGIPDVVLDLVNPEWTIFHAVQHLIQASELGTRQEKIRRVWEPTYVIVYKEAKEDEKNTKQDGSKSWNQSPSSCPLPCVSMESTGCTVEEVLLVLRLIYVLSKETQNNILESAWEDFGFPVPSDDFISKKITNKLVQQIQDPMVLSSGAQPEWCQYLTYSCPMLFPFETRQLYFACTAFGVSRSIVWLQNQRDATMERNPGPSSRRDDPHEFRIGRLKRERVKVPRGNQLLDWAMQVMKIHAERKSVLEVEFIDEEGTGLGPTLEFYALVAAELQRRDLGLWLCSDEPADTTVLVADKNEAVKPPGFYIYSQCGLFPAPLLQDGDDIKRVERYFHFLGIFLAKALQDNRLVDLPLSRPFLKLMCHGEVLSKMREKEPLANQSLSAMVTSFTEDNLHSVLSEEQSKKTRKSKIPPAEPSYAWFRGILGQEDFVEVDPHRARFLQQLQELATQKLRILADRSLNEEDKANQLKNLTIPVSDTQSGMYVTIEDLGLTFQFNPSSKVYGFAAVDLKQDGENQVVSLDNIEEYVELMTDFCLHTGVRKQMEAFKAGFNRVFPLEKLGAFSPEEVRLMLCGDQSPSWSRDDILACTEPKHGYSKESPGFQRFVNVLVNMNGEERKAFVQFATGCSSLPPGGLSNLHPRLTIVRKVDATDGSYPSVNTCVHYLKLPDYSSEDIMREKLLAATKEKGFHLN